jgi:S1-C subfamily serine protease
MEDLNKHQLILLSLLVSFVTSLATGIVTVTLIDQAPQGVTQTINQIVERTVEKVVPGETLVKEVPVIVTEEELIVKAINGTSGAVVRIVDFKDEKVPKTLASGFLTDGTGMIVSVLPVRTEGEAGVPVYKVMTESGKAFALDLAKNDESSRLVVFKVRASDMADFTKETEKVVPLKLSEKDTIVGQTIIGVGATSSGNPTATVSIVSSISAGSESAPSALKTNASNPENLGGPLLDIHGEVVGVSLASGSALTKTFVKSIIDSI